MRVRNSVVSSRPLKFFKTSLKLSFSLNASFPDPDPKHCPALVDAYHNTHYRPGMVGSSCRGWDSRDDRRVRSTLAPRGRQPSARHPACRKPWHIKKQAEAYKLLTTPRAETGSFCLFSNDWNLFISTPHHPAFSHPCLVPPPPPPLALVGIQKKNQIQIWGTRSEN